VVVPDNMATVVTRAHNTEPRLNEAFTEYAQARGFVVDPARVRRPTDKPRVERTVPFVRNSFFAGERFIDLADAQRRAQSWCEGRAGRRTHGTTQCRPVELFTVEEAPRLAPAPAGAYDLPVYATAKVPVIITSRSRSRSTRCPGTSSERRWRCARTGRWCGSPTAGSW